MVLLSINIRFIYAARATAPPASSLACASWHMQLRQTYLNPLLHNVRQSHIRTIFDRHGCNRPGHGPAPGRPMFNSREPCSELSHRAQRHSHSLKWLTSSRARRVHGVYLECASRWRLLISHGRAGPRRWDEMKAATEAVAASTSPAPMRTLLVLRERPLRCSSLSVEAR